MVFYITCYGLTASTDLGFVLRRFHSVQAAGQGDGAPAVESDRRLHPVPQQLISILHIVSQSVERATDGDLTEH